MSGSNVILTGAVINFLKKQLNSGVLNEDGLEALGIGIQCLETAYNLNDTSLTGNTHDLEQIFETHQENQKDNSDIDINEQKTVAEILKSEGNSHMNNHNFQEAISCYTKAIELDPRNAIYYCNRAAALNGFGDHDTAVEDCKSALKCDPLYHKAYARMGAAYTAKNQHEKARDSYRKASQLQPDNENYKTQLKNAEEALRNSPRSQSINIEINSNLGDIENELANVLSNLATNLFSNNSTMFSNRRSL